MPNFNGKPLRTKFDTKLADDSTKYKSWRMNPFACCR